LNGWAHTGDVVVFGGVERRRGGVIAGLDPQGKREQDTSACVT